MGNSTAWLRALAGFGRLGVDRRFALGLLAFVLLAGGFLVVTGKEWRTSLPKALERVDRRFEKAGRTFPSEEARQRQRLKQVRVPELARTCVWWATLANLVAAGVLVATRRLWSAGSVEAEGSTALRRGGPDRRFLWALGLIALGGLALRLPRMDLSLYNDEAFNFSRYIHGQFKVLKGDGSPHFEPVTWLETLWGNREGNNGVLFSLLARGCHDVWSAAVGAADGEFREWPLRLPALFPGVASIFLLGLAGFRLGGRTVGGLAAVLAAAHPWHIRYCTEARPYGLVLFGASLAVYALLRAREANQWRWWLTYGLAQWIALAAFAGALHFALGLNAAVAVALLWQSWRRRKARGIPFGPRASLQAFGRFVVANLLAAMFYLQVLAPALVQIKPAVTLNAGLQGTADLSTVRDIATYLALGMPWTDANPGNPLGPAAARLTGKTWWFAPLLLAMGMLCVSGLREVARGDPAVRILLAASLLSLVLAVVASRVTGVALHRWYATYLIPAAVLALALGGGAMLNARRREIRIAGVLALAVWAATGLGTSRVYLLFGKENLKGISHAVRGGTYPFTDAQRRVILGAFWSDPIYVPDLVYVPEAADIDRLVERALREDRPLYIEFGHRELAVEHNPETVARLEKAGDFRLEAVFPGLEEAQFTHYLFRFIDLESPEGPIIVPPRSLP